MRFASQAVATPQSGIREIVHRVIESREDVLRLEIGEAFDTPPHVITGALEAANGGATRYTNSAGVTALRETLCAKLARVNGVAAELRNVAVTTGAIEGIFLTLASLCEPGDEILIPDPGWPNYGMIAAMIGVSCRAYPCRPENGCVPLLDDVAASITSRSRVIILNTPNNPTGAVYPDVVVRGFAELAKTFGLVLLSDETYDELCLDAPSISARHSDVSLLQDEVVSVFSFSKTYGMTGWRVGYVVGDADLINMIAKLQEPVNSCVSSVSQEAALLALTGPQDSVAAQRATLRIARDEACRALDAEGCRYVRPSGAFYLWLDVEEDSFAFTQRLLAEEQIAVAPGAAFGMHGKQFVRICLASLAGHAYETMSRIARQVRPAATRDAEIVRLGDV